MDIAKKIEEIRRQPEHIRLRWVWGSVVFSMLIIFAIWLFSITVMFKDGKNNSPTNQDENTIISDQKNQTGIDANQPSNSLKDYTENNSLKIGNEGVSPSKNSNATNASTTNASSVESQSNSYTNLNSQGQ